MTAAPAAVGAPQSWLAHVRSGLQSSGVVRGAQQLAEAACCSYLLHSRSAVGAADAGGAQFCAATGVKNAMGWQPQ